MFPFSWTLNQLKQQPASGLRGRRWAPCCRAHRNLAKKAPHSKPHNDKPQKCEIYLLLEPLLHNIVNICVRRGARAEERLVDLAPVPLVPRILRVKGLRTLAPLFFSLAGVGTVSHAVNEPVRDGAIGGDICAHRQLGGRRGSARNKQDLRANSPNNMQQKVADSVPERNTEAAAQQESFQCSDTVLCGW